MEKMIRENGGKRVLRDDKYYFQIPVEQPRTVEHLPELSDQISELAEELGPEIEKIIQDPESKKALCKATYLGICLDLNATLSEKYPEEWAKAKSTFNECWKLKQLIYYGGDFPSILRIKEKFLEAGIPTPEKGLDLKIIWQDDRVCLPPDQAMELKIKD